MWKIALSITFCTGGTVILIVLCGNQAVSGETRFTAVVAFNCIKKTMNVMVMMEVTILCADLDS